MDMMRVQHKEKPKKADSNGDQRSIPKLQHGDNLTVKEFERRYHAMPELHKAELLNGVVYIDSRITKRTDPSIPPLKNGDHLTVAEFERRYENMPELKRADLVNGEVYMGSPVTFDSHGSQHFDFVGWLFYYRLNTPGVEGGDNATLKLPLGMNQPQSDACLRIRPDCGGRSRTSKGYITGGVELAGEVAASSVSFDLNQKLEAYEANGILEYVVWRVEDNEIDWFVLKGGKYQRLTKTRDGIYKSKVFPGLWLDTENMIQRDVVKVVETLQKGIASPEHKRFVKKLQAKK
jgi:hypothetical protein